MLAEQETHVRAVRAHVAVVARHTQQLFEPLYKKAERNTPWTDTEAESAEAWREALAYHCSEAAVALQAQHQDAVNLAEGYLRQAEKIEGKGGPLAERLFDTYVGLSRAIGASPGLHGLPPKQQHIIDRVWATLAAAHEHLGAMSMSEAKSRSSRIPGVTWMEFYLYGPWRKHLLLRRELPEEERKPFGFEFARAALLRAFKNLFVAVADVEIRYIRLPAAATIAYTTGWVKPEAYRELDTVLEKFPPLAPGAKAERGNWRAALNKGEPDAFRGLIDAVARELGVEKGKFVEILGPDDEVVGTASPHANVIEYTLEVTRRKARRQIIANPNAEVKALVDFIRWAER